MVAASVSATSDDWSRVSPATESGAWSVVPRARSTPTVAGPVTATDATTTTPAAANHHTRRGILTPRS
jgi:hypothetical protein